MAVWGALASTARNPKDFRGAGAPVDFFAVCLVGAMRMRVSLADKPTSLKFAAITKSHGSEHVFRYHGTFLSADRDFNF